MSAKLFFWLLAAALAGAVPPPSAHAQERALGASVDSLLDYAREQNPEYAATRHEAEAATQRTQSASALADPVLRIELENITNYGNGNGFSLLPNQVGSTKYTLMQPLSLWGKRDLKREAAEAEADQAQGQSKVTWAELSVRIKSAYAQHYLVTGNEKLTREILDLMTRLEKVAQVRYAGGLGAQQDVIRAQIELTGIRGELIELEMEQHHVHSRLNGLLARNVLAPLADAEQLRPLPAAARLDYAVLENRLRQHNPQLFADEARIRSTEKSRDLAYRNRYPDFLVGVASTQSGSRLNEWGLMLEMNLPLQQESRRSQEREAESKVLVARARKEATANQLLTDLSESIAAIDSARRTENLISTSLLPQAELAFQSALAAYQNGKVDFATLLDAQRQIRKAKLDRLKKQAEAQVRLAEIERLLGEDL